MGLSEPTTEEVMTTATKQRPLKTATVTEYSDRDAWREARRKAIGASDAAGIWGASGWCSPYSVWWSKVGPLEADEPDVIQRVGHAMEPLIAEMVTEATGLELYDPGDFAIYSHDSGCIACTPDRLTADGQAVVELKTASFSSADEWKQRIPVGYQVQLQHQMIACGVDRAIIGVLINSTSFTYHPMRLSADFARKHTAKCVAFWKQYVETETAPPTDFSKATSQALLRQWQDSKPNTIELPEDFAGLGARYDKLAKVAAAVDRHQEAIKNRVKAAMADYQLGRLPDEDGGFQWKGSNGSRRFTRKAKINDD